LFVIGDNVIRNKKQAVRRKPEKENNMNTITMIEMNSDFNLYTEAFIAMATINGSTLEDYDSPEAISQKQEAFDFGKSNFMEMNLKGQEMFNFLFPYSLRPGTSRSTKTSGYDYEERILARQDLVEMY